MRTSNQILTVACACIAGALLSGCVSAGEHNRVLDELSITQTSLNKTTQELENTQATVEQIKRTMTLLSRASATAAEDIEQAKQSLQSLDKLTARLRNSVNDLAETINRAVEKPPRIKPERLKDGPVAATPAPSP